MSEKNTRSFLFLKKPKSIILDDFVENNYNQNAKMINPVIKVLKTQ